jgi:ABC-2 type transporter
VSVDAAVETEGLRKSYGEGGRRKRLRPPGAERRGQDDRRPDPHDAARARRRHAAASPEASNAYGFTILFPVTFVSSAFVPPDTMPNWLQPGAEANPFTTMVDAARALFLDTPAGNDVWGAVAWCFGIIAVFGLLSVWRYQRAVTR